MTRLRHPRDDDWAEIAALEAGAYGELAEGRAELESRAAMSPSTCFVLDSGDGIAAYVLTLPYPFHEFPDLLLLERETHPSANLHLHDLVVAPGFRGRGLGVYLADRVVQTAREQGYQRISLVALDGLAPFWAARGYHPLPDIVVDGYGSGAMYMSRVITEQPPGTSATRRSQ
ncbi:GNAT family N-acetyltransferase [Actinokineospora enzanensis]|uniref:GNAT family N-acetyltransferase n=1 Tax=Actinokineospora enzanensis TaxID=155975 RepID=UPI001FE100B9|nr:GNAT family N-acetyltransferase [Actinokineospora enzanensis]